MKSLLCVIFDHCVNSKVMFHLFFSFQMPEYSATIRTLFEKFREKHFRWRILEKPVDEFFSLMRQSTLEYFQLEVHNFTPNELVAFDSLLRKNVVYIKAKLQRPKIDGRIKELYSTDKTFLDTELKFCASFEVKRSDIQADIQPVPPLCSCESASSTNKSDPFYTQMGIFDSIPSVRTWVRSWGYSNKEIRIEEILWQKNKEESEQGCPQAKEIIHRGKEKILLTVKRRNGHNCPFSIIVVQILIYDAFAEGKAESFYDRLSPIIGEYGKPVDRACRYNSKKNCQCNGDSTSGGITVVFGCQKHSAYPACKWCVSEEGNIKQFQLKETAREEHYTEVQSVVEEICSLTSLLMEKHLTVSFQNMTAFENDSSSCRIQSGEHVPFTGVGCVSDFCSHSHTNRNNSKHGHTSVYTLTKPDATDVQYHVLPHYILADVNEEGSKEKQLKKERKGLIEKRPVKGGLAIVPPKNSLLLEAAKHEVHSTTALPHPNRFQPTRLGIVMYQHANLHHPGHGKQFVQETYL